MAPFFLLPFSGYFHQRLQLAGLLQHGQQLNDPPGPEGERRQEKVSHAPGATALGVHPHRTAAGS